MASTSLKVPQVSQDEMLAFHETHFSKFATDHFHTHFLRPEHPPAETPTYDAADEEYYEEEEEDGLGYYPDGVKRTLTDEQIAIFRHSELEALRRARESSNTKKEEDSAHDLSDGEVSSPTPAATAKKSKKRKRGKNKNKKNNSNNGGEQIDLRKRTWDVVDKGLSSLDYGEETTEPVAAHPIQRRRISYDD
ncbi:hypothetical protein VTK26DRAFT_2629 [Humicola hyalothermophila]